MRLYSPKQLGLFNAASGIRKYDFEIAEQVEGRAGIDVRMLELKLDTRLQTWTLAL